MPKFLEKKLKAEYGANSKIPYKVMNAIGAMRGNKETAKGAEMDKKHAAKERQQEETSKFKGKSSNYSFKRPVRKVQNRYA